MLLVVSSILVCPLGCDSSASGGEETGGSIEPRAVTAEEQAACEAYAATLCAREGECSPFNIPNFYGSPEKCEKQVTRSCVRGFALPGGSKTVERVESCAQSLPLGTCTRAFGSVIGAEVCQDLPGTLKNGAACLEDYQCASKRCSLSSTTYCYRCEATPPKTAVLGADCDPSDGPDCAEGICYLGKCKKLGSLNEACDESTLCTAYLPCRNGVCSAPLGEGADCSGDADCLFGYDCASGKCTPAPPKTATVGAACGFGVGTLCAIFTQYCAGNVGSAGTCKLLAEEGEACGFDVFGDGGCASGLECRDFVCQLEGFSTCL